VDVSTITASSVCRWFTARVEPLGSRVACIVLKNVSVVLALLVMSCALVAVMVTGPMPPLGMLMGAV
jgi:hypothetical protein